MPAWEDAFNAAHAKFMAGESKDFLTECKAILATAEAIGEDALPMLDSLAFVLSSIPTPPTKALGAGLAALLIGIQVLRTKFAGQGAPQVG